MTNTNRPAVTDSPLDHCVVVTNTYPVSGRTFFTVECQSCLAVLNSGHHYRVEDRHFAELAAAEHNHRHHGGIDPFNTTRSN